jgi:hypothetical protein
MVPKDAWPPDECMMFIISWAVVSLRGGDNWVITPPLISTEALLKPDREGGNPDEITGRD